MTIIINTNVVTKTTCCCTQ